MTVPGKTAPAAGANVDSVVLHPDVPLLQCCPTTAFSECKPTEALLCFAALVAGEALRTCTLVLSPYHWTFHMLWVMYWLTICLLVTITTWLLAIQPVRSAKKAAKVGPADGVILHHTAQS